MQAPAAGGGGMMQGVGGMMAAGVGMGVASEAVRGLMGGGGGGGHGG